MYILRSFSLTVWSVGQYSVVFNMSLLVFQCGRFCFHDSGFKVAFAIGRIMSKKEPPRDLLLRIANMGDLDSICDFADYWMSGRGVKDGAPGAGHDFFVPRGLQIHYIRDYQVVIAVNPSQIVAWAVVDPRGALIHLLVAGDMRGRGIGKKILNLMHPKSIRSKTDQSTGDPSEFYTRYGYKDAGLPLAGKKQNIRIMDKVEIEGRPLRSIDKLLIFTVKEPEQ